MFIKENKPQAQPLVPPPTPAIVKGDFFDKSILGNVAMSKPQFHDVNRVNSNYVILAKSGLGMSTTVKHAVLSELLTHMEQIVIDSEAKYSKLCEGFFPWEKE